MFGHAQAQAVRATLCRDGGGCFYTEIKWKTAASVLQSGNWANRTVEAKVCFSLYLRGQRDALSLVTLTSQTCLALDTLP